MRRLSSDIRLGARKHRQEIVTIEDKEEDPDTALMEFSRLVSPIETSEILTACRARANAVLEHSELIDLPDVEPQDDDRLIGLPAAFWSRCLLKNARFLETAASRLKLAFPLSETAMPNANGEVLRNVEAAVSAAFLSGFFLARLEEFIDLPTGKTIDDLAADALATRERSIEGGNKSGRLRRSKYPEMLQIAIDMRECRPDVLNKEIAAAISDKMKLSIEHSLKILTTWTKEGRLPRREPRATSRALKSGVKGLIT